MGYNIEISINIMKHTNVTEYTNYIIKNAVDLNCTTYYLISEMERDIRINRNHLVLCVHFENNEINNCAKFIKCIKKNKALHIESIYEDNIVCSLLFASQYYLLTIDKDKVVNYRRERSYSDEDMIILNELRQ